MTVFILRLLILALNLHMPVGRKHVMNVRQEIETELVLTREKKRFKKQKYKVRTKFVRKRLPTRFKSTKPKDHRFSDQRKLRRMYRNS